jgi:hypothetical protein
VGWHFVGGVDVWVKERRERGEVVDIIGVAEEDSVIVNRNEEERGEEKVLELVSVLVVLHDQ